MSQAGYDDQEQVMSRKTLMVSPLRFFHIRLTSSLSAKESCLTTATRGVLLLASTRSVGWETGQAGGVLVASIASIDSVDAAPHLPRRSGLPQWP
jgi:hypothetical protein